MHHSLIVAQAKPHMKVTHGQALHHFFQMAKLGFFRAQKLTPGGGIKKQITHFQGGSSRVGTGHNHRFHIAAFGLHLPTRTGFIGTGRECEPCHRTDTGQCLAPKAQGGHPFQIIQIMNFTGGMAGNGERQVILLNTRAVIADAYQFHTALLHVDIKACCPSIQAVFQ